MAFWNESRRGSRLDLNVMARSSDRAINWLLLVMLVAFAFSVWYVSAQTRAPVQTSTGSATITEPAATPQSPSAGSTQPAPTPNAAP